MKVTHLGHACVLLETGSARLLIDPGVWSLDFEDLRDLDGVLITHQHLDHIDPVRLPSLMAANQHAELVIDPGTTAEVEKLGLPARVANVGDVIELAGAKVTAVGGVHALIHADIEVPPNLGYVVDDGAFYHPGDSLHVPEQDIAILGLPLDAPWLRLGEAVDFYRAVNPKVALPIHEQTASQKGIDIAHYRFRSLGPEGARFEVPPVGTTIEVN
ncbi:L-ascorbate metabolism protein UlaG (beta-lactamase superfamily) [Actinokineospora baliensis]|uniref:MBL fold metallo-hydrolase n=1 Tax=Actinokineospora baliensis TaxID=547056 RepID=UPI00195C98EE|nr:MBL fold metallo-hydrolase [Actinokineospora baliensis]MBM7770754.1 L-ascorbate metabolism protein UlaG (beta-lactamase superfamily) [Actinokineospora baliensis]